jgi:hypothetical protein
MVPEGFPDFSEAAGHDSGWDEHFVRLRRVTA